MSGIYLHIPFCKQACHYCDFHFSTNMEKKGPMIAALQTELELRKHEFEGETVETIYFGGGTPSVLEIEEIAAILGTIHECYTVVENAEVTLEANPDDLSTAKISQLANSPINRLSIGVQSFDAEDLKLMNRAHNASEAMACIEAARAVFDNISIDLIYGIPYMTNARWKQNIDRALSFDVPHISSYALTVEPKTALAAYIKKGTVPPVDDSVAQEHFQILIDTLEAAGYVHYETSNFGRPGFFSRNNTAYWQGKKYLGIGPSAHSYDGIRRGWNINNNPKYLRAIQAGLLPMETEILSKRDRYNEYVMTGLRTIWGVSLGRVLSEFGPKYLEYLLQQAEPHRQNHLLYLDGDTLLISKKGKFLADGIASDLFMVNLT
jgi:oxygen-independent coproporphyrinogen-3 oxidase